MTSPMRYRDELRFLVDSLQQAVERHGDAVLAWHSYYTRAGAFELVINIKVRREIQIFGDDLVAPSRPVEARDHDRLDDPDVGLHDDFPRRAADDAAASIP